MLKKLITLASLTAALAGAGWINPARVPLKTGSDDSFIIGIFRPDGVIVPFAQYANRKWTNPWHITQPGEQADEPDTIADLPKPWYESFVKQSGDWYLLPSSRDTRTVGTSRSVQVCSHCQQVWGLLSDYPNPQQPEKNACVRNLGVAFSEKREARSFEPLTNEAAEWNQLLTILAPEFEQAESAAVKKELELSRQYSPKLPLAEERAKVPLSMVDLYRTKLPDGLTLFYFEAHKEYPKPREANDAGCNNVSVFSGWAFRDAQGKLALLDSQLASTDCDMKEGDVTVPFVILRLDGKSFAIVEEDGYEGESYVILEIRKDRVRRVLETFAGSC